MPRLTDTDDEQPKAITANFKFSGVNLATLGATEYTLVGIVTDNSGSVGAFAAEEIKAIKEIVLTCQQSPRADNLLLRITRFNHNLEEIHGFKALQDCNPADYDRALSPSGSTALYDAAVNAVESVAKQGKALMDSDFMANAIVFVITDGEDNASSQSAAGVQKAVQLAMKAENLESIITVLVGVNIRDLSMKRYLEAFAKDGGFTPIPRKDPSTGKQQVDSNGARVFDPYFNVDTSDSQAFARFLGFVSQSISSQSQALGTGGPSQALPTV